MALFVFSSASVTVNTAEPPAEALLVSKPASAILNATEADATTTTLSVYSYETDTPSVCPAMMEFTSCTGSCRYMLRSPTVAGGIVGQPLESNYILSVRLPL